MRERTHPQALTVVLLAVGVALLAAGVLLSARDERSADALASLSETVHDTDATPRGDAAGIDWDALESQNPDTVAWLQVSNTSVDRWDAAWQSVAKVRDVQALRVWLDWAVSDSSASNGASGGLASSATRALVLVTCNGRAFHPETRTVTVFVSTSATPGA